MMPRISTVVMAVVLIVLGCPVPSTAQSDGGARIEMEIEKANLSLDELRRLVPALGGIALPADVREATRDGGLISRSAPGPVTSPEC